MVVVLVLAGVAVLGAVVVLAMGRGGELAETHPDYPRQPLGADGRPITGPDVAGMRFPRTFWGYQPQVMDEALRRIVVTLSERDARVAELEQQLHDLRRRAGAEHAGPIGALHGIEEQAAVGVPPLLRKDAAETIDGGHAQDERVGGAKEDRS